MVWIDLKVLFSNLHCNYHLYKVYILYIGESYQDNNLLNYYKVYILYSLVSIIQLFLALTCTKH